MNSSEFKDISERLIDKSNSLDDKEKILIKLLDLFQKDRIFMCRYCRIAEENIYITLIDLYFTINDQNSKCLKALFSLLDLLLLTIECDKSVYNYVYQLFSHYYFNQNILTEAIFLKYLTLLKHLYQNGTPEEYPNILVKPKNFFYFINQDSIKFDYEKDDVIDLHKGVSVLIFFKIRITDNQNQIQNIISLNDEQNSTIFNLYINKSNKIISLNYREQTLTNSNDIIIPDNQYVFLLFTVNDSSVNVNLCNGQNEFISSRYEVEITDLLVNSILLFNNCFGECSTIIMLNRYVNTNDIDMNKIYSDFPYGISKLKNIQKFFTYIPQDYIKNFYFPTPHSSEGNFLDDFFGGQRGEFINECDSHLYVNNAKHISKIGDIKVILPIIEMYYTTSEKGLIKLTSEMFYSYLDLVNIILNKRKDNIKNCEDVNFFQILSLFLEQFPTEIFTKKIMRKIIEIKDSILEFSMSLYKAFFENILLNEKIYYKFQIEEQSTLWSDLGNQLFNYDIEQILTLMPMSKICLLLKYYDDKKYYEYCCEEHQQAFVQNINKRTMEPNLKAKTKRLIELVQKIVNKTDISKSNEPLVLFQMLCLDLSPCLMKILLEIFINMFNNKDLYLKFKANELADTSKSGFDYIIINLLSRALPDVKGDLIYLLSIARRRKRLEEDMLDGLFSNINLSEAFYYYDTNLDNEHKLKEIKNISKHCADKVRDNSQYFDKNLCEEFNNKTKFLIFTQDYFLKNIKNIYNALFLLMLGKPNENYAKMDDLKLTPKDNIFNERVIEIIINFIINTKSDEYNIKLNQDVLALLENNLENCYSLYSNKILIGWTIMNMIRGFKNEKENVLFDLAKQVNFKLFTNTVLQDRKCKQVLQAYPIMTMNNFLAWEYNLKREDPIFKELTRNIFKENFLFLKPYALKDKNNNNIGNILENILTMFSMVLDYTTLFNSDSDDILDDEDNFDGNYSTFMTIIPHIFKYNLSLDSNGQMTDFKLLSDIYSSFSYNWAFDNVISSIPGMDSCKNNAYLKYENIVKYLIYNKSTKNSLSNYLSVMNYVFLSKFNWKVSASVLMFLSLVISMKNKDENEEVVKWINELKNFVLFYICAACNIWEGAKEIDENQLNNIKKDTGDVVLFSMCFLAEEYYRKNNSNLYSDSIKSTLKEIFILITVLIDNIYQMSEKSKKITLNNIFKKSLNRKELTEYGFYLLFTENGNNLLSKDYIEKLKKEDFNIIPLIFVENPWKDSIFKSQIMKERLISFFNLEDYKERLDLRKKNFVNMYTIGQISNKIKKNSNKSKLNEILKLIPKYQINISKYSTGSFMVIKEKRNMYKLIKKNLFLWKGMWSNNEDLYENKLKLKIINHYTKFLSRPLLSPILDIDYYVPDFTNFETKKMFREESQNKICLDIDNLLTPNLASSDNTYLVNTDPTSNDMNFLNHIDYYTDKTLYKLNINFTKKIFISKEEDFMNFFSELRTLSANENLRKHENFYQCCFVKPSHHIKGVFFVNDNTVTFRVFINQIKGNNIISDEDFDNEPSTEGGIKIKTYDEGFDFERNTCFGSYFVFHHKDKDSLTFTLPYDRITHLFRRRYYQRDNSIEFLSKNFKSYYFTFKNIKDRESCIKDILAHYGGSEIKEIKMDLQKTKDEFDNIVGYEIAKKSIFSVGKLKLSHIIKKWQNFKMSNFEFIMWINLFGNRSYSDISQYPVFPWIFTDYDSKIIGEESFRDLGVPMGMLCLCDEGEKRKEGYIENYNTLEELMNEEEDPDMPLPKQTPYFFGSHYSSPIYVMHYLTRIFPYCAISIELQGDKFDKADRLFLNISNSFLCASSCKGDVRELISEFYYLPEMLININNLNLGMTQENTSVDNVACPEWSDKDPYKFVYEMRKYFESDEISNNINKWIDLIFGYKSRGKEAVGACNVYNADSYEIDLEQYKKHDEKVVKLKTVEFGICAKQISTIKFPAKKKENINKLLIDGDALNWSKNKVNLNVIFSNFDVKEQTYKNLISFKIVEKNEKILAIYREKDTIKVMKIPSVNSGTQKVIRHGVKLDKKGSTPLNYTLAQNNTLNTTTTSTSLKLQFTKTIQPIAQNVKKFNINSSITQTAKIYNNLGKVSDYYDLKNNNKNPPLIYIQSPNKDNLITIIQGGYYHSKLLFTIIDSSYHEKLENEDQNTEGGAAEEEKENVNVNDEIDNTDEIPKYILSYKSIFVMKDPFPITAICSMNDLNVDKDKEKDNKDVNIIIGNSIGNIMILNITNIDSDPTITVVETFINDFTEINSICYNENLNVFGSISRNYANLYAVPSYKFYRSIYIPDKVCDELFISSCPLPSVAIIHNKENEIETYSINGKFLINQIEKDLIKSPNIIKDSNFCEYLIYLSCNQITVRNLPYLEIKCVVEPNIEDPEFIDIDPEMKNCFIANKYGTNWVSIKNNE